MSDEIHDETPTCPMTEQEREDSLRCTALRFAINRSHGSEPIAETVSRATEYLNFLLGGRSQLTPPNPKP